MKTQQVVIENPVINSPFQEPRRHFRFGDDGITDDIVCDRRPSSNYIPIARPKKTGNQQTFEEWTADRSRSEHILGRVYEYFLSQFASAEGKMGGQFCTPQIRRTPTTVTFGSGRAMAQSTVGKAI